ncbi:hypothetical protein EI94DRAFT_1704673 [Lactarius quietus]|nr:hypothetical protein EI94DRAFT_1704673 [Lactarius quietus]
MPSSRARTPLPCLQLSPVMGPNPAPSGSPLGGSQCLFVGPGQDAPYRPPYGAPPFPPYPPYPPFQCQPFPHPPFPNLPFQQEVFQRQPFPHQPFLHPLLQHPPTYQSPFPYLPTQCLLVQYGPYPMGALPDPVPHQVTMHQRGQGLPAQDFNATAGTAPPACVEQKVKGNERGWAKWGATAMLTESDLSTQTYQIHGSVTEPRNQVILGYKLAGDTGGITELTCEPQWKKAMVHMRERIIASRMHAVAMELKNLHMTANMTKGTPREGEVHPRWGHST